MCVFCGSSAEAAYVELSQAAEELGDIPDRFMCPIGCDIMRDPVTLPTSGQVMDFMVLLLWGGEGRERRKRSYRMLCYMDRCGVDTSAAQTENIRKGRVGIESVGLST